MTAPTAPSSRGSETSAWPARTAAGDSGGRIAYALLIGYGAADAASRSRGR